MSTNVPASLEDRCYLDGRYFAALLGGTGQVYTEPLIIKVGTRNHLPFVETRFDALTKIARDNLLLRLVIEVEVDNRLLARHSNLLHLRPEGVYRYDPSLLESNVFDMYIDHILFFVFGIQIYRYLTAPIPESPLPGCPVSGLCNAAVIKFAYALLGQGDFDMSNLEGYAERIRTQYPLAPGVPDMEFGWGGALVGGLGGAAIGGLIAGPAGFLVGGLAGGLLGYGVTGGFGGGYGNGYGGGYGGGYGF